MATHDRIDQWIQQGHNPFLRAIAYEQSGGVMTTSEISELNRLAAKCRATRTPAESRDPLVEYDSARMEDQ